MVFSSLLSLIGNTPMVEVRGFDTGVCRLFAKLESHNPGGSIKDRPALYMIDAAEREGSLKPGSLLVEATAGNTGLGLALVASRKGYPLTMVIPDKMSQEKIWHLKALGATIVLTRSDVAKGHPEYYMDMAERIARETPNALFINQFNNPANPRAHEETTAREIDEQLNGEVHAVVCGVGSGGTLTGLSAYFRKAKPHVEMILADPMGSMIAGIAQPSCVGKPGSYLVEGIGGGFLPPICDLSFVKKAYSITDQESFDSARMLLLREGILAGSSSGTLLAAALRYCKEQKEPKNVVFLVCDSGNKYLSKMFNSHWLYEQGLTEEVTHNDLRDLIARSFARGEVVSVRPDDLLSRAYARMKLYDISQVPVLDGDRLLGILDEDDLLIALQSDSQAFNQPVQKLMTSHLETLPLNASIESVSRVLRQGKTAIVCDGHTFVGLITKIDLIRYLRRKHG